VVYNTIPIHLNCNSNAGILQRYTFLSFFSAFKRCAAGDDADVVIFVSSLSMIGLRLHCIISCVQPKSAFAVKLIRLSTYSREATHEK